MRMRRKKHLEEKLAQCDNLICFPHVDSDVREAVQTKEYLDYAAVFGNDHPVHMEIGCGKGQFVTELAARHPELNFIAVEVNRNVISMACHRAMEMGLSNVLFLQGGAELLQKYIPSGSIGRIYLNFSCPYPKATYANRRLTNPKYLEIYRDICAEGAEIHQKTDNMHFFEYSIEQFTAAGYKLKNVSLDLHASDFEGNIVTEYENRFASMGMPIYRLEAYRD